MERETGASRREAPAWSVLHSAAGQSLPVAVMPSALMLVLTFVGLSAGCGDAAPARSGGAIGSFTHRLRNDRAMPLA